MSDDHKRVAAVRMIVVVVVNLADVSLIEAIVASKSRPTPLDEVVAAEVMSNLESVSYVESVLVSPL